MFSRENVRIENARLYPPEVVDRLYTALSNGAELHADQSRTNFYDLNAGGHTYFIYISHATGSVTLIATWRRKGTSADAKLAEQHRWWRRIAEHIHAV
jgi:hypothetical protein